MSRLIKDRLHSRKRYGYKPFDTTKLPDLKGLLELKDKFMRELD